MRPLFNFEQFSLIETANSSFSSEIDAIFESIAAAVGNPVKYTKIKNNAKKYQKALITKALVDVEYEKKKKAGLEPKQKEVLTAATKAKKQAMDDLASAVSQRMDDLATTDPLKNVAKLAKTKAKISAAETSLKSADETETAELKNKIEKMKTVSSNIEQELKKTKTKPDAKEETIKQQEPKKSNTESKEIESIKVKIERIQAELENAKKEKENLDIAYDKAKGTSTENEAAKEVAAQKKVVDDIEDALNKAKENLEKAKTNAKKQ